MNELVKYMVGNQEVTLTPSIIRNYLTNGNGQNVSDQEVKLFTELCHYRGLNPYLREAYLIKYGNSPATIVVGKDAVLKKALSNPNYGGHEAGITVVNRDGKIERRAGSMILPREELVGGWCKVSKVTKAGNESSMHEVSFDEYAQKDDAGKLKSSWKTKPATMVRKVALVQALREMFPEDTDGMYEAEELGIDEKNLPTTPIDTTKVVADITPSEVEPEPETTTVYDPNLDLLDLSDADFLSANFTSGGKTKMIGQIPSATWQKILDYDGATESQKLVAERALQLLTPLPFSEE